MAAGGECACVKGARGPRVGAGRRCGEERLRLCDCFGALHVVTYASLCAGLTGSREAVGDHCLSQGPETNDFPGPNCRLET